MMELILEELQNGINFGRQKPAHFGSGQVREGGWEATRMGRFEFNLKSCSRKVCMLLRKKRSELLKTSVSYISSIL